MGQSLSADPIDCGDDVTLIKASTCRFAALRDLGTDRRHSLKIKLIFSKWVYTKRVIWTVVKLPVFREICFTIWAQEIHLITNTV